MQKKYILSQIGEKKYAILDNKMILKHLNQ